MGASKINKEGWVREDKSRGATPKKPEKRQVLEGTGCSLALAARELHGGLAQARSIRSQWGGVEDWGEKAHTVIE